MELDNLEYEIVEIESIECIKNGFNDEYVYDIEIDDEFHTFIGNGILVHNSLYICHENLVEYIENHLVKEINESKTLTYDQKAQITVSLHKDFLDQANNNFMYDYYKSRGVESIHEFELETIASRGF